MNPPAVAEAPLNQLTMLITAEGKWVLPDSDEFLAGLEDPDPDYDAVGFAVRNLGYVKFQVLDRLVTEIELHPRNVGLRALLAVEGRLAQTGTNLFRIKYLEQEWHSEITASAEHTAARLRELCAPAFEPPLTSRFRVEPQDPTQLLEKDEHRGEALGQMAMKWRVAFGKFDLGVMELAGRHGLLPRLVLLGFARPDSSPLLRFMGGAQRWSGEAYRLDGVGHPIDEMPDHEYGAWVSEFYKSVANSGQPRYDVVTAQMEYLNEPGRPRRTARYERLLLPWRTPEGPLVSSCIKLVSDDSGANLAPVGSDSSASRKLPKSS
jgi:hypothetical protein